MKYHFEKNIKWIITCVVIILSICLSGTPKVLAIGNGLTVSPMLQEVIANPGEQQKGSFMISNPSSATNDLFYELSVEPFYTNEHGEITYQAEGNMGEITNWIEFDTSAKGKIEPNEAKDVIFTINVPESAPAGGQYFAIMVTETDGEPLEKNTELAEEGERKTTIKETYRIAHLVYVEITGNVIKQGEISDASVPSFLLSGNITGSSSIKNVGNVHGIATYKLQVYPLFSGEEIYTNEESPSSALILPNRTLYKETSWDQTPSIGIFNVVYTVEFEGVTTQVSKLVIICPIWLLFIIIFAIFALIFYFIAKSKTRKKASQKANKN